MTDDCGAHILVVDDDRDMRDILRTCFEGEAYQVSEAANAKQLWALLTPEIDLVTLDLKLVGEDGIAIAREIRRQSDVPIIMVTAKNDPVDKVVGLEIGADDYITKPFHLREVLARVRSLLRRSRSVPSTSSAIGQSHSQRIGFGEWILDLDRHDLANRDGISCEMTMGQLMLLEVLITNPNKTLSRNQIMDLLHGVDWMPNDRSIDNQIARLRRVIEPDPGNPRYIATVHGRGYKLIGTIKAV